MPSWILYVLLTAAGALIDLAIAMLVAGAASRKDRSWGSFFWLAFVMGPLIPALVIAALPFREDDPRHPARNRS
jgi:ABC-type Fe3+ transport system permease subunit